MASRPTATGIRLVKRIQYNFSAISQATTEPTSTRPHGSGITSAASSNDAAAPGTSTQAADVDTSATAETAAHEAAQMNTVALDVSELDTAATRSDLNTAILDTRKVGPAGADSTVLDYNLLDLDATTQHVHMPSDLLDQLEV